VYKKSHVSIYHTKINTRELKKQNTEKKKIFEDLMRKAEINLLTSQLHV